MESKPPFVAVIGPFYNGENHVTGWVSGLLLQNYAHFKIYVVDDASTDGTSQRFKNELSGQTIPFEIITLKQNKGPSAARNTAIMKALSDGADLILLLDSDCRVPPDWIRRHAEFHQKHLEVAVLGGAIGGMAAGPVGKADGYCSWFTAVPYSRNGRVAKLHLSSTNMSIKNYVFSKVGLFDEKLATGEDVSFCRKVQKAGLFLWLQSDIVVRHLDREDLEAAKKHHYRWGLHSYTLSLQAQGGYYGLLKKMNQKFLVAALIPVITLLNTLLILIQYTRRSPKVWLYLPWIWRLKWANAKGVYHGFLNPTLCLRA